MPTSSPSIASEKMRHAREKLDAHVREIVAWHFNPETGTPFWLERAQSLGFDPRKEVTHFDDLKKFGLFEDEWLRGGPVRRWVPKALANKPIYVFETGGTTGIPKTRINIDDFRIDYEMLSDTLPEKYFPKGANASASLPKYASSEDGDRSIKINVFPENSAASFATSSGSL